VIMPRVQLKNCIEHQALQVRTSVSVRTESEWDNCLTEWPCDHIEPLKDREMEGHKHVVLRDRMSQDGRSNYTRSDEELFTMEPIGGASI
jgi:hypothetical protein